MVDVKTLTYREIEGLEIRADVYAPADAEGGPALLFFHGGALIMGDRTWIPPMLISKVNDAGISVVSVDYRLAPETKLPEIVSDVEAAYTWMRTTGASQFSFDPDRIAVAGGSAGGYLALVAGSNCSPAPAAVVSFYGYGNLTGTWYTTPNPFYTNAHDPISEDRARSVVGGAPISRDPMSQTESRHDFYLYCRQQGTWPLEISGHDQSDIDWFGPYEPLQNITASHPPTMLLHGEADTDVPIEQSVLLANEFDKYGVAHQLVTDPDWDHAFDLKGAPRTAEAIDNVVEFLLRHGVGGR